MQIIPVHTRKFLPPRDNLYNLITSHCPPLLSEDIVVISSKVVAIHQGRAIRKKDALNYNELVKKEADTMISVKDDAINRLPLTIKDRTFIPSAGLDKSNANDYYVLWPENPFAEARSIYQKVKQHYSLTKMGIIISDSFLVPMRYGSIGISIAFHGIEPLKDYRGKRDVFNRELTMTQSNIVDSLSTLANYYMGEGNEQIPVVILRKVPHIVFNENYDSNAFFIPESQDLYYPLLRSMQKIEADSSSECGHE